MDDLFDEPGDLGFFDLHEEDIEPEDMNDNNPFYEPFPGEEEA